jgi:hypothetical protein
MRTFGLKLNRRKIMKISRIVQARIFSAGLISLIAISVSTAAHAQTLDGPFQIKILASSSQVDSVISVVNDGARGAATTPGNTAAVTGAICANFYAYSSVDGSLISCCSCPVGPNAARILNVNTDLIPAPASSKLPTRTVVKLLATVPVGGSCVNSSAAVATATFTPGLVAWGTSALPLLQVNPQVSINQQSESSFLPVTLSAGELSKLGSQCTFYNGGGTTRVCPSCAG